MNLSRKFVFEGGLALAAALTLATGLTAQTPAPTPKPATAPAAKVHHVEKMHKEGMSKEGMKADCDIMMAKHKEMEEKLQAMDATLDRLVAEMNAAAQSTAPDALEKPMAAVVMELVRQRKAMRVMKTHMEHEMMEHMMRHMHAKGAGMDDCPMMKAGHATGGMS